MKSRVADFQRSVAPQVEAKDEAWFLDQLRRKSPNMFQRGRDFMIVCPFHIDHDPSLGVDRFNGYFKCFSCGVGGGWNKLADKLGMEKLKYSGGSWDDEDDAPLNSIEAASDAIVRSLTKMGIKPHKQEGRGDINRPLVEPWPIDRGWRGLDPGLLHGLGCVRVIDLAHNVERVGLPIRTPEGDLIGYTCRAIDPEDAEPKYTPLSGDRETWREKELPARTSLFLVEKILEEGWDRVVIVEGPFDAMRLWAQGVPALAILGTSNWTKEKRAVLAGLGLRAAIVMMDADRSGQDIQPVILDDLMPIMRAKGLTLPPGTKDPGMLTSSQVAWVKRTLDAM